MNIFLPCQGNRNTHDLLRPGVLQHPGAFDECSTGGADVVDQQDPFSSYISHGLIDTQYIGPAGGIITNTRLGRMSTFFSRRRTG